MPTSIIDNTLGQSTVVAFADREDAGENPASSTKSDDLQSFIFDLETSIENELKATAPQEHEALATFTCIMPPLTLVDGSNQPAVTSVDETNLTGPAPENPKQINTSINVGIPDDLLTINQPENAQVDLGKLSTRVPENPYPPAATIPTEPYKWASGPVSLAKPTPAKPENSNELSVVQTRSRKATSHTDLSRPFIETVPSGNPSTFNNEKVKNPQLKPVANIISAPEINTDRSVSLGGYGDSSTAEEPEPSRSAAANVPNHPNDNASKHPAPITDTQTNSVQQTSNTVPPGQNIEVATFKPLTEGFGDALPQTFNRSIGATASLVSTNTANNPTHSLPSGSQIIGQISAAISSGPENSIELRLDPPELGRVVVSISQNDSGLSAHISAGRQDVVEFLRQNANLLARELSLAGFEESSLEFSFSQNQDENDPNPDDSNSAQADEKTRIEKQTAAGIHHIEVHGLDIRL